MESPRKLIVAVNTVSHVLDAVTDSEGHHRLLGYEGKLLDLILTALGYRYELRSPADKEWGRKKADGNWSGLIGMIQHEEADLAFNDLAITEHRMEVVRFSTPYTIDAYLFAIEKSQNIKSSLAFLHPFTLTVWLCLLGAMLSTTAVFYQVNSRKISFGRIFWCLYSSMLKQPVIFRSKKTKWKAFVSVWMLFALVISSSYSASLLSFLMVPVQDTTVRNLRQLSTAVQKGTHRCFTVRGDNTVSYLIHSKDTHLRSLGKAIEKNGWYFEASDTANIHSHISPTTAELQVRTQAELFYGGGSHAGKVILSDDNIYSLPVAIAVRRNFCCLRKLNRIITRINSGGFYKKFLDDESLMFFLLNSKEESSESVTGKISVANMFGPFMLLCLGHIFAILMCFGEVIIWNFMEGSRF